MADWKDNNFDITTDLASIATLFEAKKIKRMYEIADLYPTKIAHLLGTNTDRYNAKLANPEKFSVADILKLAYIFKIDPNLISDVIQNQVEQLISKKIKNKLSNR